MALYTNAVIIIIIIIISVSFVDIILWYVTCNIRSSSVETAMNFQLYSYACKIHCVSKKKLAPFIVVITRSNVNDSNNI